MRVSVMCAHKLDTVCLAVKLTRAQLYVETTLLLLLLHTRQFVKVRLPENGLFELISMS